METLIARLSRLNELPGISANFLPLLKSLNDDAFGKVLVGRLISADAQLSLIVLNRANSALKATLEPVSSVVEAVMRLGFQELKRVVVAHYSLVVAEGGRGWGLDRQSSWLGAYAGAHAAANIADWSGAAGADVCYTAALLRDCGKLAMDHLCDPAAISALMEEPGSTSSATELERKAFGFDHAEAGAALAAKWSLPATLCTAIRHHHGPLTDDGVATVVQCADAVAINMGMGVGLDGLRYATHSEALRALGITRADFEDICMSTLEGCGDALQFFASETPQ